MAEGRVMDGSAGIPDVHPIEGDRWVVLTPSVDHEAWLKVLARAAKDHGMVVVTPGVDRTDDGSRPALHVTHDPDLFAAAPRDRLAVLMPQPETAAEATALLYDFYPPQSVCQASLLLAKAVALESPVRLFTAAQLARNPEAIALFPGMIVVPPQSERGSPRPAVSVALGMFRPGRQPVGATAVWSERLFAYDPGSCIDGAPLGVLDLTGRPRTVFYGPYLALPPGRWEATMRFAIDEAASGHEMCFDWGQADSFVSQIVIPPKGGVYELRLEHTAETIELWQFRMIIMEGVFDGRLTFQGCTVALLPDPSNDATVALTQMAG